MLILDKLFGHIPKPDDPAPNIKVFNDGTLGKTGGSTAGALPSQVLRVEHSHPDRGSGAYTNTGPIFCMIETLDERNFCLRSRITTRRVVDDGKTLFLIANCHECMATRSFQLDQALFFVTMDGEVVEPDEFKREMLLIYETGLNSETLPSLVRANRDFGVFIRPAVTLTLAAAGKDFAFDVSAVGRMLRYCEIEAQHLASSGVIGANPDSTAFGRILRRIPTLRPDRIAVVQALKDLMGWQNKDASRRFFEFLYEVLSFNPVLLLGADMFVQDLEYMIGQDAEKFREMANEWAWA